METKEIVNWFRKRSKNFSWWNTKRLFPFQPEFVAANAGGKYDDTIQTKRRSTQAWARPHGFSHPPFYATEEGWLEIMEICPTDPRGHTFNEYKVCISSDLWISHQLLYWREQLHPSEWDLQIFASLPVHYSGFRRAQIPSIAFMFFRSLYCFATLTKRCPNIQLPISLTRICIVIVITLST